MNRIVDFYREHQISPVRQDISDFEKHVMRREKLYRQLGMPSILFKNANICEVGPGGGYNAVVLKHWGCKLTLVEPNETGRKEIKELFGKMNIDDYELIGKGVEELQSNDKFDVVIAEGFLQSIDNWDIVFASLMKLVENHGILVITCADEWGMFVERMKRLVGQSAIKDILDYDKKVEKLVDIFGPQLKLLSGASRLPIDYVQDNLLCEDFNCTNYLTLKKAIQFVGEEWDILGCSGPNFFQDYSWYKDIDADYKAEYCRQYDKKAYNLILAGRDEIAISEKQAQDAEDIMKRIKELQIVFEECKEYEEKYIEEIIVLLEQLGSVMYEFDGEMETFVRETIAILKRGKDIGDLTEFPMFCKSFGRSQQYISFIKNE